MGVQSVSTTDEEAGFEASGNEWIGRRVCRWEADDCILGTCRSWRSAESIVEQAFNAVDDDGSGLLDRDEVRSLLEMMGKRPTEADLDAAMAELDSDGSGEVDFDEFSEYWEAHAEDGGGLLQGVMADNSQPLWRVVLDSGIATEMEGDKMMAVLNQYEILEPRLLADLQTANAATEPPAWQRRQAMNAAVLWSENWGLESHALAAQAKASSRKLLEALLVEQLERLKEQQAACVAVVAGVEGDGNGGRDWREGQLGKERFNKDFEPPPLDALQLFSVTDGGEPYRPVSSLETSDDLSDGTCGNDGFLRWQALASVQEVDLKRVAAIGKALKRSLSAVVWEWDKKQQRIDLDTKASGKLVQQRDVMTGKILTGEWRMEVRSALLPLSSTVSPACAGWLCASCAFWRCANSQYGSSCPSVTGSYVAWRRVR